MAIPNLDFDVSGADLAYSSQSQRSSVLSPHSRRASSTRSPAGSILGLHIPSSESGIGAYQLPDDPFSVGGSSVSKLRGFGEIYNDDDYAAIGDDIDFGFDEYGNLIDEGHARQLTEEAASVRAGRLGSDPAAGERMRREHEEGQAGRVQDPVHNLDDEGDYNMFSDDYAMELPEAEAFPLTRSANLAGSPTPSTSITAAAVQVQRKRVPKVITADDNLELTTAELARWQRDYVKNMEKESQLKQVYRRNVLARKNAKVWVWEAGINGVGYGIGENRYAGPAAFKMFHGEALRAAITGSDIAPVDVSRKRTAADNGQASDRRVRPRFENDNEEQMGRGHDSDAMMQFDDDTIMEVGRDAPSALDEHMTSAMPWNISASQGQGISSSIQGGPGYFSGSGRHSSVYGLPGLGGRTGSRIMSASPLLGRGREMPELEEIERLDDLGDSFLGGDDDDAFIGRGASSPPAGPTDTQFEAYGRAAEVDTQTAGESQWVRDALDRESLNFLAYIKEKLAERRFDDDDEDELAGPAGPGYVVFQTLFPPEQNSKMVAAQAFHHVLSLATKNLLGVQQMGGLGEIRLAVKDGEEDILEADVGEGDDEVDEEEEEL